MVTFVRKSREAAGSNPAALMGSISGPLKRNGGRQADKWGSIIRTLTSRRPAASLEETQNVEKGGKKGAIEIDSPPPIKKIVSFESNCVVCVVL